MTIPGFSEDSPAKRHDLRAPADNDWTYADLAWQRKRGLESRILGYRRAAEILHRAMLEHGSPRDLDTVVFPYAACWRHCVELQLKSVLSQLRALLDLSAASPNHHKIDQLWREARPLILIASPDEAKQDLDTVEGIIRQLTQLDPDGQAFRYARTTKGLETLSTVDQINLVAFHAGMTDVADFLDGADTMLNEAASFKHEIAYYYETEFGPSWCDFG